MTIGKARGRLR